MRRILIASAVVLGTALPVSAADLPLKASPSVVTAPIYDWTGLYFGGSVGGIWDRPGVQYDATTGTSNTYSGTSSWVAGIHGVGMWQMGHLVLGGEIDYRWTDLNHSVTCPLITFRCTQDTPNLFTVGGRIGGAWDKWLIYANGGYAQTRINVAAFNIATGATLESASANSGGWYAGLGVSYAITPNISLSAQYTHVAANEVLMTFPIATDNRTASNRFDMIELRADFKLLPWSSPVVAKY